MSPAGSTRHCPVNRLFRRIWQYRSWKFWPSRRLCLAHSLSDLPCLWRISPRCLPLPAVACCPECHRLQHSRNRTSEYGRWQCATRPALRFCDTFVGETRKVSCLPGLPGAKPDLGRHNRLGLLGGAQRYPTRLPKLQAARGVMDRALPHSGRRCYWVLPINCQVPVAINATPTKVSQSWARYLRRVGGLRGQRMIG